jgi:hypothetical protein
MRAQAPCDSCMRVAKVLDKWHLTGAPDQDIQLRDGRNTLVADHVRRIARETIYLGDIARQGLHVWYADGYPCRDTLLAMNGPLWLKRGADGASSDQAAVPIVPASEYSCSALESTSGRFLGFGVMASNNPNPRFWNSDKIIGGGYALAGGRLGPGVEMALGMNVFSIDYSTHFPVYGHIRWYPFGGPRVNSMLHYVPRKCQFMSPGDTAVGPPLSECSANGAQEGRDSTVYVLEERWIAQRTYVPFLYAESGFEIIDGLRQSYGFLIGFGAGLPLPDPFIVTLGYRHLDPDIATVTATVGVVLR